MRRIRDMFIFFAAALGVVTPAVAIGLAAGGTMLASPSVALASPQAVIRDCAQDGKLDHHYSLSDLKNAEKKLPTDVDEYTNCRDVINQAEVQGSGGKSHGNAHAAVSGAGNSGGGGGGSHASQKDVRALNNAQSDGGKPLELHGQKVMPGSGGVFNTSGAANDLPTPVLLALIAVLALTAAGGLVALKRRFPEVFGAALRLLRR
ncbi:MAG TPA: hypothetical protein VH817_12685 [Thermoleophilaceae bacterium]|jgi:hypothetical protein